MSTPTRPPTPAPRDKSIVVLDAETGRLVRGLAPDLVWLFSDNGSARGVGDVPQPDGGKGSVFESGVRVPCVLSGLDVPAGADMRELAHVVDVLPTLAALRGVTLPGPVDGVSLWGAIRSGRTAREHVYTQTFEPNGFGPRVEEKEAVAERRYKMTRVDGVERLYHLGQDPDERSPVDPATVPDVAARLRGLLDRYGE